MIPVLRWLLVVFGTAETMSLLDRVTDIQTLSEPIGFAWLSTFAALCFAVIRMSIEIE